MGLLHDANSGHAQKRTQEVGSETAQEVTTRALAEGLTLRLSDGNRSGYFGVSSKPLKGTKKFEFEAQVKRGTKCVSLGRFDTAEAAALCIARTPEGRAAFGQRKMTVKEVEEEAWAEGLTLRLSGSNKSGFFGVTCETRFRTATFQARVTYDGKEVCLGSFTTPEEAALAVARETVKAKREPAAAKEVPMSP